jgi:hypothetical protein
VAILEGLLVLVANLIPQCHEIVAVGSTQYSKYSASKKETNLDYWLVVLTILKNISQWEGLFHRLWKIKKCLKPSTWTSIEDCA